MQSIKMYIVPCFRVCSYMLHVVVCFFVCMFFGGYCFVCVFFGGGGCCFLERDLGVER